jgi:hypothetical protein
VSEDDVLPESENQHCTWCAGWGDIVTRGLIECIPFRLCGVCANGLRLATPEDVAQNRKTLLAKAMIEHCQPDSATPN